MQLNVRKTQIGGCQIKGYPTITDNKNSNNENNKNNKNNIIIKDNTGNK